MPKHNTLQSWGGVIWNKVTDSTVSHIVPPKYCISHNAEPERGEKISAYLNSISQREVQSVHNIIQKNKSHAHLYVCTGQWESDSRDKFSLLPLTCSQGLIQLKWAFMFLFFSILHPLLLHKILITWIIVHSLSVNCSAVEHFTEPQLKPGRWKQDGDGGGMRGVRERGREGALMLFHCHWTVKRRWDPHHVLLAQQRHNHLHIY